ncbi:uncharacterized protein LJ206_014466 [Theristicus caerulescens]
MVRVWGAMAPAQRLLLVLLLLVALHARAAWAAPWRARGADEGGGNGYPASRLDVGLEPLGHPGPVPAGEGDRASRLGSRSEAAGDRMVTDVPVGRTFPAPRLDAALQPGRHRRVPRRAKYHGKGGKKCLEPSEVLREILRELERGHETHQEAVKSEVFPEGSSGSLPVPPKETEAMQAAGMPVLSRPREDHHSRVYEFFRTDSGVLNERTMNVSSPQGTTSAFWPHDAPGRCAAAAVFSLPLVILLCCIMIRWRRKRKERLASALQAQLESGSHPLRRDMRTSRPGNPERWTSRPGTPEGQTSRPDNPESQTSRPGTPESQTKALLRRNQPSALQPEPQLTQPPGPPRPLARTSSED